MALRIKDILAKKTFILSIVIILTAVFLRFYKLYDTATFLGDQGRDAIIVKRILSFEHFPAIGAPSSLGQIYLGPFFYYLISPFLLLFNFNPFGLAFGVALISVIGLIGCYLIVKKEINIKTSLFFLVLLSFSFVNIQFSRFSWNPNLLPVFSFLTLYFFYKSLNSKNFIYAILFGSFFSFSIQLHYLTLFLIVPILLTYLIQLYADKLMSFPRNKIIIWFFSFAFFSLPLIIFDLRHQFLNSKNFLKLFTDQKIINSATYLSKLLETNQSLYQHIFQISFNPTVALIILVCFFIFIVLKKEFLKQNFIFLNFVNIFSYLLVFSVLNSSRHPHYFGSIYFSFYLIIAYLLSTVKGKYNTRFIIVAVFIGLYLFTNFKQYKFLYLGGNQFKRADSVATSIIANKPKRPYQILALPDAKTDGNIRYYLEIKGWQPLPEDTLEQPTELYVLCYDKNCQVSGNPQWQIASFKDAIIGKMWQTEGIKIYKLIHK